MLLFSTKYDIKDLRFLSPLRILFQYEEHSEKVLDTIFLLNMDQRPVRGIIQPRTVFCIIFKGN
jgi:hypothetical protein